MYVRLKVKCLPCGLHFVLCTEREEDRKANKIYCPECGLVEGKVLWREEVDGFIFQEVPGAADLVGLQ